MKNYTIYFLIIAIVTGILGFVNWDIPGIGFFRIVCLISSIAMFISCLDAVLVVRKAKIQKKRNTAITTKEAEKSNS